jgi:hypothetical protein
MHSTRTLSAIALLVPFLAASLPAEAAKATNIRAARAECFRQANAAAAAAGGIASADPAAQSERQAAGMDAYRACCRKQGIAPKILGHLSSERPPPRAVFRLDRQTWSGSSAGIAYSSEANTTYRSSEPA